MTRVRVAFVDRDGTLIEEPDDFQVDRLDKIRLVPDVVSALLRLRDAGFRLVLVSNQDGLGSASFAEDDFQAVHEFMLRLFASQGIEFDEQFICPHLADEGCACRKPRTGLLTRYLINIDLDTDRSCVIGDRDTDLELARNLGLRGFRLDGEIGWHGIVDELLDGARRVRVERCTNETDIAVSVDLDADGPIVVETGIGFYDHMLEQVARHANIALTVSCRGDLHVDEHHTVEDVAIALGQAVREALGDKRGIGRYGFVLPMDEAQARVALDLSGRPYAVFEANLQRESVGGLATELVGSRPQSASGGHPG
jgi:imidazoleglycerol-phosphate dehydratase/histidinol-phosphatase